MVNDNVKSIVDTALSGDYVTTESLFKSEMMSRVSEYLDAKKEQVAQNFFEEKMTPKVKAKEEIIIHGLKKDEPDFKKRYGNRWKNVMFAVAAKEAEKK